VDALISRNWMRNSDRWRRAVWSRGALADDRMQGSPRLRVGDNLDAWARVAAYRW
jgi:hypothetical protein